MILRREDGQVLVATSILILGLAIAFVAMVDLGKSVYRKIEGQNAADYAAMTGSTVLAEALNSLSILNFFIGLLLPEYFNPAGRATIRALQKAQDEIARATPKLAKAAAIKAGYEAGGDYVIPSNNPSLMVSRLRFGPFTFWLKDDYRATKQKPHGDRYIKVLVGNKREQSFGEGLDVKGTGIYWATAVGAVEGHWLGYSWIIPIPDYASFLVPK